MYAIRSYYVLTDTDSLPAGEPESLASSRARSTAPEAGLTDAYAGMAEAGTYQSPAPISVP